MYWPFELVFTSIFYDTNNDNASIAPNWIYIYPILLQFVSLLPTRHRRQFKKWLCQFIRKQTTQLCLIWLKGTFKSRGNVYKKSQNSIEGRDGLLSLTYYICKMCYNAPIWNSLFRDHNWDQQSIVKQSDHKVKL